MLAPKEFLVHLTFQSFDYERT